MSERGTQCHGARWPVLPEEQVMTNCAFTCSGTHRGVGMRGLACALVLRGRLLGPREVIFACGGHVSWLVRQCRGRTRHGLGRAVSPGAIEPPVGLLQRRRAVKRRSCARENAPGVSPAPRQRQTVSVLGFGLNCWHSKPVSGWAFRTSSPRICDAT